MKVIDGVVLIVSSIIIVAIIAVLVSPSGKSTSLIQTASSTLANILKIVVSPLSSGTSQSS